MFIGHYAVGLAAKKAATKPSLGTYFIAASFIDLLWPVFLLLGIEHVEIDPGNTAVTPLNFTHYPYSHSLLATIVWSALFGGGYFLFRRDKRGALWLGIAVFSHWVLDAISHRPDLPLFPGSGTYIGLGLWNVPAGSFIIEVVLFLAGVMIYRKVMAPRDKMGKIAFWSLVVFLLVSYLANYFGPPPPDVQTLAYVSFSAWLINAWGYWIDRHWKAAL